MLSGVSVFGNHAPGTAIGVAECKHCVGTQGCFDWGPTSATGVNLCGSRLSGPAQ